MRNAHKIPTRARHGEHVAQHPHQQPPLDEALQTAGGCRSVLRILKHAASWSHVYHSYAFDAQPRHLRGLDWPRGLRDTVDTTQEYLDEVVAWFEQSCAKWSSSLESLPDDAFDEQRACHWEATMPLWEIVLMATTYWTYHAGELNQILAILRGEA